MYHSMKFLKNLKHIFAIWAVVMLLIVCMVSILGSSFIIPITQFFTYRDAPFQNVLYTHHWKPSTRDIAIIKIDDNSLNELQANSDRRMLTLPKKVYIDLINKLESVGVK